MSFRRRAILSGGKLEEVVTVNITINMGTYNAPFYIIDTSNYITPIETININASGSTSFTVNIPYGTLYAFKIGSSDYTLSDYSIYTANQPTRNINLNFNLDLKWVPILHKASNQTVSSSERPCFLYTVKNNRFAEMDTLKDKGAVIYGIKAGKTYYGSASGHVEDYRITLNNEDYIQYYAAKAARYTYTNYYAYVYYKSGTNKWRTPTKSGDYYTLTYSTPKSISSLDGPDYPYFINIESYVYVTKSTYKAVTGLDYPR